MLCSSHGHNDTTEAIGNIVNKTLAVGNGAGGTDKELDQGRKRQVHWIQVAYVENYGGVGQKSLRR